MFHFNVLLVIKETTRFLFVFFLETANMQKSVTHALQFRFTCIFVCHYFVEHFASNKDLQDSVIFRCLWAWLLSQFIYTYFFEKKRVWNILFSIPNCYGGYIQVIDCLYKLYVGHHILSESLVHSGYGVLIVGVY